MADDTNPIEHLRRLAESERVVMLATLAPGQAIEGRPVTMLESDDRGACWFLVDRSADWVAALHDGSAATVFGSDSDDGSWFSASGSAHLVDDRGRITELWNPVAGAWFEGADDPNLVALEVRVGTLAWWESSDNRLVRMWHLATAALGRNEGQTGDHGVDTLAPR